MSLPSQAQLRAFLAVLLSSSLTGAARALGISQPAVSQLLEALEALEAAIGVRLFERGGRRALPTPAAERLRPLAQAALAAMADISGRGRRSRSSWRPATPRICWRASRKGASISVW